jgi:hypothetical protein
MLEQLKDLPKVRRAQQDRRRATDSGHQQVDLRARVLTLWFHKDEITIADVRA